ncbi:MAG: 30S ribosomal protein S6 [Dehalococcoidia bacterium]|nr:30S ribosomal protein S6 [Dehalococcoidia bacterium]
MSNYEVVVLINPEVDEGEVSKVMGKVLQFITDKGGVVGETKHWGRKKLAYSIKKFKEADYNSAVFKLEPGLLKEFDSNLRASKDILRHLIVKVKGKIGGVVDGEPE